MSRIQVSRSMRPAYVARSNDAKAQCGDTRRDRARESRFPQPRSPVAGPPPRTRLRQHRHCAPAPVPAAARTIFFAPWSPTWSVLPADATATRSHRRRGRPNSAATSQLSATHAQGSGARASCSSTTPGSPKTAPSQRLRLGHAPILGASDSTSTSGTATPQRCRAGAAAPIRPGCVCFGRGATPEAGVQVAEWL
jgi:hypothetical protein